MKTANLALMISITSDLAWGGYSAEGSIRELLGFRAETIPEFHTSNTKDVQETPIQKTTNAHGNPRGERDNAKSPSKSAHLAPLSASTPYALVEMNPGDAP